MGKTPVGRFTRSARAAARRLGVNLSVACPRCYVCMRVLSPALRRVALTLPPDEGSEVIAVCLPCAELWRAGCGLVDVPHAAPGGES